MNQNFKQMEQPTLPQKPDSKKSLKRVKASHLSSNPINEHSEYGHSHFEVEVHKAFFRIFNL